MITSFCKGSFQVPSSLRARKTAPYFLRLWFRRSTTSHTTLYETSRSTIFMIEIIMFSRPSISPSLSLSSVRLIYERPGFLLICAKPRVSAIAYQLYPAILSRAFRERPDPSLMTELTKFLGEVDRNHLPRRIALVLFEFTRGSFILQPGRNDARVVSDFVHTLGVRGKSQPTARFYNR